MSLEVRWDNDDKTVLVWEFGETWDWSEYYRVADQATALLDTVDYKVDFLIDMHLARKLPPQTMPHIQRMAFDKGHVNRGRIVVVGGNMLMSTVVNTLNKLYSRKNPSIFTAATITEARTRLAEMRAS